MTKEELLNKFMDINPIALLFDSVPDLCDSLLTSNVGYNDQTGWRWGIHDIYKNGIHIWVETVRNNIKDNEYIITDKGGNQFTVGAVYNNYSYKIQSGKDILNILAKEVEQYLKSKI